MGGATGVATGARNLSPRTHSAWTLDKVADNTSHMFKDARAFDQPIGDWKLDQATSHMYICSFAQRASSHPIPKEWKVRDDRHGEY
jgi:hypothetical protein